MEGRPLFLDLSTFESLVRNQFEFMQLIDQRRLRPEYRQKSMAVYAKLRKPRSALNGKTSRMGDARISSCSHLLRLPAQRIIFPLPAYRVIQRRCWWHSGVEKSAGELATLLFRALQGCSFRASLGDLVQRSSSLASFVDSIL